MLLFFDHLIEFDFLNYRKDFKESKKILTLHLYYVGSHTLSRCCYMFSILLRIVEIQYDLESLHQLYLRLPMKMLFKILMNISFNKQFLKKE